MAENRPPMARAAAPTLPVPMTGDIIEPNALGQIVQSEINQQIATARAFPRSIKAFTENAAGLVTMNEAVAQECFYALKRKNRDGGNTDIEGASARFAEIISNIYGNIRAGARVIAEDKTHVVAQGFFHDLEKNTAITIEVRRRITTSEGRRYSEDMVNVTCQAALAIALRNAILKGIPKAFWYPIYLAARQCAVGNVETLAKRRVELINYFGKMGVKQEQVFALLKVKGIEDISGENLMELRGIANAIKEGESTIDEEFPAMTLTKAAAVKNDPPREEPKPGPEKNVAKKEEPKPEDSDPPGEEAAHDDAVNQKEYQEPANELPDKLPSADVAHEENSDLNW